MFSVDYSLTRNAKSFEGRVAVTVTCARGLGGPIKHAKDVLSHDSWLLFPNLGCSKLRSEMGRVQTGRVYGVGEVSLLEASRSVGMYDGWTPLVGSLQVIGSCEDVEDAYKAVARVPKDVLLDREGEHKWEVTERKANSSSSSFLPRDSHSHVEESRLMDRSWRRERSLLPGADGASSQIPFAAAPARREKDHQEPLADRGRNSLPLRRSFDPSFVRSSSPVLEEEPTLQGVDPVEFPSVASREDVQRLQRQIVEEEGWRYIREYERRQKVLQYTAGQRSSARGGREEEGRTSLSSSLAASGLRAPSTILLSSSNASPSSFLGRDLTTMTRRAE
ncbi:hypothetical protein GUITHDRAFT_146529, partial [Guillardia theta CCMP2712]